MKDVEKKALTPIIFNNDWANARYGTYRKRQREVEGHDSPKEAIRASRGMLRLQISGSTEFVWHDTRFSDTSTESCIP